MKKLFITLVAALMTVTASAQNVAGSKFVRPVIGMTISDITKSETQSKVGFVAGTEYGIAPNKNLALTAGVLYSREGAKSEDDGSMKMNNDYINIPLLVNYYPIPSLAIKVGVQPGFLVSSNTVFDIKSNGQTTSESISSMDMFNKFDFAIPVGVSYEFKNITLDARYNIGITKTINKKNIQGTQNRYVSITLGYRFNH